MSDMTKFHKISIIYCTASSMQSYLHCTDNT